MVEPSLAKTVQTLIEQDFSIQDALERDYANFSGIARMLKPKVEEILGKKVTIEGLITSVKRTKPLYVSQTDFQKIIAGSIISLRTDVSKISLEKTRKNLEKARLVSVNYPEAFFQVLEGTTTLTLITDQRIFNEVHSVFEDVEKLDEKQNLAAIMVQSPKDIVNTPGCIVAFYNPIARSRINIEETVSCFNETIIVLKMEDAARAFSILSDLIANARKKLT
ncbi:MAG: hypothetical protein QXI71_02115 [Candidatus Bathyarchaeia archaeon]|nr:hypothetical protein [Candidatus Bathyarchaeota archaeon]